MIAPLRSLYARSPQDQRLLRFLLSSMEPCRLEALYIGFAWGEDFYSWLPISWGTHVELQWSGMEIDRKACEQMQQVIGGRARIFHGNLLRSEIPESDIIVAGHTWTPKVSNTLAGMQRLLERTRMVLFARDNKLPEAYLHDMAPDFRVFRHHFNVPGKVWHCSAHGYHIFIRRSVDLSNLYENAWVDLLESKAESRYNEPTANRAEAH